MRPLQELPDLPQNASLLDFLRSQASPPGGPGDYALGAWQLHTHPDLIDRLRELAPGWPLAAAYGVPLLACQGIAAVVALGTDWLAVRIDPLPHGVETLEPAPAWTFAGGDWHIVDPWQGQLSSAAGTRVLRDLVSGALSYAASIAPGPGLRGVELCSQHRRQAKSAAISLAPPLIVPAAGGPGEGPRSRHHDTPDPSNELQLPL